MSFYNKRKASSTQTPVKSGGFTLIELLVVMTIIGILASIVLFSIDSARLKGQDSAHKAQILEILKALELHYTTTGEYPLSAGAAGTGGFLDQIDASFYGVGKAIRKLPDDAGTKYYYCVSSNRNSILIAVDTEEDDGGVGSDFCNITRGPGPNYGCNVWQAANAVDSCLLRF